MTTENKIDAYAKAYLEDYTFERVLVHARQSIVLESIRRIQPRTIVEAGVGCDLLLDRAVETGIAFERWVMIEPAKLFAEPALRRVRQDGRCSLIESFAEQAVDSIRNDFPEGVDLVICSSLMHEVDDVAAFLAACRRMLRAGGHIHVNVPNMLSLHRRIARAMGLIASEDAMSARNQTLGQHRGFTPLSLESAVVTNGFNIEDKGGYFLKPFTHAQMEQARAFLDDSVMQGLLQIGRELPDLACEIYVNATTAGIREFDASAR